ncbi:MAG: GNAT family N-acetyltransferase [Prevotella sp.]|jgi:lipid II:glycine glycyltransferase (peptidoglycan interpeptide bridge formation enzyme)|uniref:GNAT family N-acetyltransferase n=1 Tax=Segatella cerevisiae TaxID=2053716 RepID=A0ABT1BUZ4_9BACT|nr:GNAT family N-acetyltransferase [Segatella cerevisiae]MCI1245940.1 GNAT family N-acetyltransferase [Prevotella sp.]MCO6024610.1 GNAT family N-acetyltransferase [Segatella cerevisiae]
MEGIHIRIIQKGRDLPEMKADNFFHSPELFRITEQTPGTTPYMVVAENAQGQCIAHLLATIRRRGTLIPPFLYANGRIYGQGEYDSSIQHPEELFRMMLEAITQKFKRHLCFYVEVSEIHPKMFGYRMFRLCHYFPIHWQEIHNSLHSKDPQERLTRKIHLRIEKAYAQGVETRAAYSPEEVHKFYKLLKGFYRIKFRRLIPPEKQFSELSRNDKAQILVTLYHGKLIGGSVCVYSQGNAYLWYLASKRKSYPTLHPNTMTIWYAIQYAYEHHYAHVYFMDVGLPFKKNPFRDFILRFGGKPVARYRWFHFYFPLLNRFLGWLFKE